MNLYITLSLLKSKNETEICRKQFSRGKKRIKIKPSWKKCGVEWGMERKLKGDFYLSFFQY